MAQVGPKCSSIQLQYLIAAQAATASDTNGGNTSGGDKSCRNRSGSDNLVTSIMHRQ